MAMNRSNFLGPQDIESVGRAWQTKALLDPHMWDIKSTSIPRSLHLPSSTFHHNPLSSIALQRDIKESL